MAESFDVFLSHNSKDKPAVRELAEALRARGVNVWLDEWELVPGRPWQEALEEIIETAQSAAVLVGKDGLGPWQDTEMRGCLSEFVDRKLPVIPVLLPNAPEVPRLPIFLKGFTWVDLRGGLTEEGIKRLQWGITGRRPDCSKPTSPATPVLGTMATIERVVVEAQPAPDKMDKMKPSPPKSPWPTTRKAVLAFILPVLAIALWSIVKLNREPTKTVTARPPEMIHDAKTIPSPQPTVVPQTEGELEKSKPPTETSQHRHKAYLEPLEFSLADRESKSLLSGQVTVRLAFHSFGSKEVATLYLEVLGHDPERRALLGTNSHRVFFSVAGSNFAVTAVQVNAIDKTARVRLEPLAPNTAKDKGRSE